MRIRFLADIAKPSWGYLLAAFVANLASALFEGSSIGLLALALQVIGDPTRSSYGPPARLLNALHLQIGLGSLFLLLVLLAIGAQILRSSLQFLGEAATAFVQSRVQMETHHKIFARILRLPFSKVARHRQGNLTDYLHQANNLHEVFEKLNELAYSSLLVAVYGLILLWLCWPLMLVVIVAYSFVSALIRRIIQTIERHSKTYIQTSVRLNERTTEFLQGLRLLHTLGRQEETIQAIAELTREAITDRRKATLWARAVEPMTDILTVTATGTLLLAGYLALVPRGLMTLPLLLAFLLALYRVTTRLRGVYSNWAHLAGRIPSIDRILEILSEEPIQPETGGRLFLGFRKEIVFDGVTLRHRLEEAPAVSNLSFVIPKGSFTALVGASGAGKSTVADLLLRLFEPTSGSIRVDGVDLRQIEPVSWRNRLGVVSQDPFLFHMSIRENIAFGEPNATEDQVMVAAHAAHAHEFIQHLAKGYDTVIGDRGYRLSSGQRQRIALARALIGWPEILILDEATSALDSESERFIQQALEEQRGQHTLLIIAHRISTVARADRILVLSGGRIAEEGTHSQLLAADGTYNRLWQLQSQEQMEIPVELEVKSL